MKKENVYRFSLQFAADTEPRIRAGEFLERLGNKKSAVVVEALNDYLQKHPELQTETVQIQIAVQADLRRQRLETLIRDIVAEQLSRSVAAGTSEPDTSIAFEADISQMLSNLELFT